MSTVDAERFSWLLKQYYEQQIQLGAHGTVLCAACWDRQMTLLFPPVGATVIGSRVACTGIHFVGQRKS